jgi:hypothetical protein
VLLFLEERESRGETLVKEEEDHVYRMDCCLQSMVCVDSGSCDACNIQYTMIVRRRTLSNLSCDVDVSNSRSATTARRGVAHLKSRQGWIIRSRRYGKVGLTWSRRTLERVGGSKQRDGRYMKFHDVCGALWGI